MRPDPPVRADGRCSGPGCRKKLVLPPHVREPFCSTQCCRAFHNAPIPDESIWALNYGQGSP